ncbi:MAG TPA: M48 family metalloprotease [Terriglobales bacterium]|nr:M48 family metalloprotease [Terriglobales bacterium]
MKPVGLVDVSPDVSDSPEAARYNRIRRWLGIGDTALGIALLLVLLATGWTGSLRDIALKASYHNSYPLAVFFYVFELALLAKLLSLPLDYYGFRLEHRFNLSNQKLRGWIADEIKGFFVSLILYAILVELLYFTIRLNPEIWWLVAWAVFIALMIFFAQIAPVVLFPLFYKFNPLENDELRDRLVRLSERAGTRVRGVYEWKLSEKSKKANAALAGLGATRRIILADTLLQNYTPDEIEAVLAHELGHHVRKHVFKGIIVQIGLTFLGFFAVDAVLRYAIERQHMFEQMSDFAALPLLALVSTLLSLLLMPLWNAYSRRNEREADLYCCQAIPSVTPYISALNKLCAQNLGERHPSRLVEVLFHSHPPISKRIAAAEQFAQRSVAK